MLKSIGSDDHLRQSAPNAFHDPVGFDRILVGLLHRAGGEIPAELEPRISLQPSADQAHADRCWTFLRVHGLVTGERHNGALTPSGQKSLASACKHISSQHGPGLPERRLIAALLRSKFENNAA